MSRRTDNSVHATPVHQHRFHLLDAIRGIAALLVVAYHAPPDFGRLVPYRSGFLAVDLFFALSGFVIAFSYERRLQEGYSYRNFVVARLIRLYPIYVFCTVLAVAIGIATSHVLSYHFLPLQLLLGVMMFPDIFHGNKAAVYPLDFPAWSLLCELLSNLAYGMLVLWKIAGRWMLYLLIVLSGCFMIAAVHASGTLDSGSVLGTLPLGLARVTYSFGAGVVVFWFHRSRQDQRLTGVSSALLASLICVVVFAALATSLTLQPVIQLIMVLAGFPVLIYLGARTSITGVTARCAAFLGLISYPIYLLHIPFFAMFRGRSMHHLAASQPQARPAIALASIAFLTFLAWLVAEYFDKPARRLITQRYNMWVNHVAA